MSADERAAAPPPFAATPDVDHSDGPDDATHVLLMYGDYECPYTRAAHLAMRALQQQQARAGTASFRYVFRHFPLREIHPHAQAAAEAAEAALAQGRFWAMHDRLFAHQRALGDEDLRRHAEAVGLDVARFERELATCAHAARVQRDVQRALADGARGTPTLLIDGAPYHGDRTPAAFADVLAS